MFTLHNGDCLEYLATLPAESVDAFITDPPYFLPVQHYQTRKVFQRNFSDLGILEHFFKDLFTQVRRVLKNDGHFYIFCDGQSYPLFWYYGYQFAKSVRPLIWDKSVSINGYAWRHQHEIILFGEMPKAKPIPTGDGDILKCRAVPVNDRQHPAEKPVDLMEKLIKKCGQVICDPFMGSGATGKACKNLGRDFIGIETDKDYFRYAEQAFFTPSNNRLHMDAGDSPRLPSQSTPEGFTPTEADSTPAPRK